MQATVTPPFSATTITIISRSIPHIRSPCPQCAGRTSSLSTRQFSSTRRRDALVKNNVTNIDSRLPRQSSMKSQVHKASKQQMGNDLGKLPQTLILPPSSELPPWTTLKRTKIHWLQLKTAFKDWWSLVVFLKWDAKRDPLTGKKMRRPMELDKRRDYAQVLHEQFHIALGKGDMRALQAMCCEGLAGAARTRIEKRKALRKNVERWELLGYFGIGYPAWLDKWPLSPLLPNHHARVVSDRLAPLPVADSYIRQCIVRIRSRQQYQLADMDKRTTHRHTDYVVIQKITTKGEEGHWRLWGLTEPTTMDEIDTMLAGGTKDVGVTLVERIRDKISNLAGL
ncbi:hypothetical protein A1O7_09799 [Cladophialophora yegresii CBS 114405]|uniref:Tim44-like domain-containing protein n=1 Tax=Cladophialophora yegresii CBS 114405 TaxID=1182544 RepID=W9W7C2_9EURO|nr:uncharacterized protein A1O7_09799 [Cladophialophora yegresii CBS 114405]EXJ54459.1 hypothetical protein A1O7_09799 [Cladophialophora yegresii CBS 114405]